MESRSENELDELKHQQIRIEYESANQNTSYSKKIGFEISNSDKFHPDRCYLQKNS